ncbi:hypothetical protein [Rubritalea sp.]|uniref:hypothetical protein n=1 Tax=Rubritalea sp. TaxID=2109375 RepID=UPI003EFAADFF
MKTPIKLLICLFSLLCSVYAQSEQADAFEKKAKSTFSCVIWDKLETEQLFFQYKKQFHPLKLRKGTRSKSFPIEKSDFFTLYTKQEVDGKTQYQPYAQCKMPSFKQRALFLLIPDSTSTERPLRITGVDDSLGSFPPGSYKFFNLTKTPLQTLINGQKSRVSAGSIKVVDANVPVKGGMLPFIIGANNKIIFETRLFSQPKERKMVFVFPETSKNKARPIQLKFLSQLVNPSELMAQK